MIRVLATGFGPFPGVPENPTDALMARLVAAPPDLGADVAVTPYVFPTTYHGLEERLDRLGRTHAPDVAVHFGVASTATGFRIETLARNCRALDRVDASGAVPPDAAIASGETDRFSTLPVPAIVAALERAGIPVERSDDCGTYLCNALFFATAARLVPAFRPAIAGFVHVGQPDTRFTMDVLERGARLAIAESVAAWRAFAPKPVEMLPNLGPVSAAALRAAGIATAGELARAGPIEAFRRWRGHAAKRPSRTALWAIVGALDGRPFHSLSKAERARLSALLDGVTA